MVTPCGHTREPAANRGQSTAAGMSYPDRQLVPLTTLLSQTCARSSTPRNPSFHVLTIASEVSPRRLLNDRLASPSARVAGVVMQVITPGAGQAIPYGMPGAVSVKRELRTYCLDGVSRLTVTRAFLLGGLVVSR